MAPVAADSSSTTRATLADGRVNDRIANYTAFWEKDSKNDGETQKANRLDNYTEVVNGTSADSFLLSMLTRIGYYDGATELYEYGWAQSFHFSRFYKGEAFHQSVRPSPPSLSP
jgi:sterol 24-C-methyltransferase